MIRYIYIINQTWRKFSARGSAPGSRFRCRHNIYVIWLRQFWIPAKCLPLAKKRGNEISKDLKSPIFFLPDGNSSKFQNFAGRQFCIQKRCPAKFYGHWKSASIVAQSIFGKQSLLVIPPTTLHHHRENPQSSPGGGRNNWGAILMTCWLLFNAV